MTTANLKLVTETLVNLNAVLAYSTSTPTAVCGTYALIDDLISNLVSIKNSMKTEEKVLIIGINTQIADASTFDGADDIVCTASANLSCTSGLGGEDTARYGAADKGTTALYPAILGAGSTREYNEPVVFSVIAEAAKLIKDLKDNVLAAVDPIVLAGTPTIAA